MARKTTEVGKLLYRLNYFLANPSSTPDQREILISFVEGILLETGNYRGFGYLDTDEVEGAGSRCFYYVSEAIRAEYEAQEKLTNTVLHKEMQG